MFWRNSALIAAGLLLPGIALAQTAGQLPAPHYRSLTIETTPTTTVQTNGVLSTPALTSVAPMAGDQFNLAKTYDTALTGAPHQVVTLGTLSVPAITQVWNNFDNFKYTVPGGDASPLSAVVSRYIQMERRTDAPLVPSWPLIVSSLDFTNHPSSVAGPAIGMELDLETSGLDDQGSPFTATGSRSALTIIGKRGRNYGGTDSEANIGISLFSNPATFSFKRVINFGTAWSVAALNLAAGTQKPGASTILLAAGQTIAFDAAATRTLSYDAGSGKLFFAVSGVNVWSIDASGNVRAAGTITASTTP